MVWIKPGDEINTSWIRLAPAPQRGCSFELPADPAKVARAYFASPLKHLLLLTPPQVLLFPAVDNRNVTILSIH